MFNRFRRNESDNYESREAYQRQRLAEQRAREQREREDDAYHRQNLANEPEDDVDTSSYYPHYAPKKHHSHIALWIVGIIIVVVIGICYLGSNSGSDKGNQANQPSQQTTQRPVVNKKVVNNNGSSEADQAQHRIDHLQAIMNQIQLNESEQQRAIKLYEAQSAQTQGRIYSAIKHLNNTLPNNSIGNGMKRRLAEHEIDKYS